MTSSLCFVCLTAFIVCYCCAVRSTVKLRGYAYTVSRRKNKSKIQKKIKYSFNEKCVYKTANLMSKKDKLLLIKYFLLQFVLLYDIIAVTKIGFCILMPVRAMVRAGKSKKDYIFSKVKEDL